MRPNLEGGACTELPMHVVDHFFGPHDHDTAGMVMARAALNMCNFHCPVLDKCRQVALNGPRPKSGIVAGMTAREAHIARAWQAYESRPDLPVPKQPRPDWLERPESAETVEQTLVEEELGVER